MQKDKRTFRESTASWNAENMREEDGEEVADEEGAGMQTHHGQVDSLANNNGNNNMELHKEVQSLVTEN